MEHGYFHEENLIKVFGPPSLYTVEPGHFVQLKSGGPKMIVMDSTGAAPTGTTKVAWDDDDGNRQVEEFLIVCLTAWPAADEYFGRK